MVKKEALKRTPLCLEPNRIGGNHRGRVRVDKRLLLPQSRQTDPFILTHIVVKPCAGGCHGIGIARHLHIKAIQSWARTGTSLVAH